MTDFLLELRSEEIPARMQRKATEDLARLFGDSLAKAGLAAESVETFATPRRLALIAKGLPLATEAVSEETKGPKVGAPPQAMEGFLRKTGLTQDQLVDRDGVYFAVVEKAGRKTADVLAEAIPAIIRAFPWPKSQRWGAASASTESLRWVRPLQGIVALFGQDVVPCEVDGILSGYQTTGHRFHHSGPITIGSADDYIEKLRACHVIVHFSERCAIVRDGAKAATKAAGLTLVEDEGLVAENAGLTEWPVPMLGRFDPAFLEVPQEVIQLTARVNQKYFVCHDANGKLANAFVCTANIAANDGGVAIIAGNEKVLAARLSDAKFFWEQDLKVPLERQAEKLSQIVFHEKLGTVADKVERVAKLARWLVEEEIVGGSSPASATKLVTPAKAGVSGGSVPTPEMPAFAGMTKEELADQAERAARLCKADLVTGMVGEFPELQGIMGGYYARAQGDGTRESEAVADAIRDHYKPVGQGDEVPTAPVTVAVSLADKLDTLVGFFGIQERPTGSKDPFALRRAALAVVRLVKINNLRLPLRHSFLVARALIIENWAKRYAVISLESVDSSPAPVLAANKLLGATGEIYAFDWDVDGEGTLTVDDTSYSTYSYSYLEECKAIEHSLASLDDLTGNLFQYFTDRLEEAQKAEGTRVDLIRSVVPRNFVRFSPDDLWPFDPPSEHSSKPDFLSVRLRNWSIPDDLVALLARVTALQNYITTAEGANLLAAYKRAANILKGSHPVSPVLDKASDAPMSDAGEQQMPQTGEEDPFVDVDQGMRAAIAGNHGRTEGTVPEGAVAADIALLGALDLAEPQAEKAILEERFGDAMAALATLREPIDRFFDEVMVNDEDPDKRAFRLGLLARFRDAVHRVADFSKIEGSSTADRGLLR